MRVLAVSLRTHGRLHYLDAGAVEASVGDEVLVPTEHGHVVATVVWGPAEVDWTVADLPLCGGAASASDLDREAARDERRREIEAVARELIGRHGLPMTVVATDAIGDDDPDRLSVIYYKAPQRVDFRALVGDLARTLRTRVDLRQIGARDVAALAGGVGSCGREFCCCLLCPVNEPLPAKVTRDQEAAQGSLGLAGACGRLKCCLAYEADAYAQFAACAPRVGSVVATPDGEGVVSGHAVPIDSVWVRAQEGVRAVRLDEVTVVHPAPGHEPVRPRPALPNVPAAPVPRPPRGRRPFRRRDRTQPDPSGEG